MFTHDWRPGDRVVSIAVSQSVAETGLGTIQRVLLDRAILLWDDGEQSEERLQDLIIAGFNSSKIVGFSAEDQFGHRSQKEWWTGSPIIAEDITSEIAISERLVVSNMMISGLPLSIDTMEGIAWGSFINENFKQGS